jgi:nitrite reductase/ring-hydroxylating ferredoxin subunit
VSASARRSEDAKGRDDRQFDGKSRNCNTFSDLSPVVHHGDRPLWMASAERAEHSRRDDACRPALAAGASPRESIPARAAVGCLGDRLAVLRSARQVGKEEQMAQPQACPLARRSLLLGAGAAGLTALLSACGGDDPAPATAGGSPTGAATEPSEEAVPPGPELPQGALISTDEVPVNGGVLVDDVLVVQPRKGTFRAYDASCPHQQTIVEEPDSEGVITCPGHLSRFRASDGSRISGPANRGLRKIDVKVDQGYVVQV